MQNLIQMVAHFDLTAPSFRAKISVLSPKMAFIIQTWPAYVFKNNKMLKKMGAQSGLISYTKVCTHSVHPVLGQKTLF